MYLCKLTATGCNLMDQSEKSILSLRLFTIFRTTAQLLYYTILNTSIIYCLAVSLIALYLCHSFTSVFPSKLL